MSMKRAKEVRRRGREGGDDGFFSSKTPPKQWDWDKDISPQPDESFTKYAPQSRYALGALVLHPKFGKGVVVDVDAQRVEVLFQDGPKKLAHGLPG